MVADLALSQTVYQGVVSGGAGTPADPSAGLTIFSSLTLVYDVTDNGPDAAPFEFHTTIPVTRNGYTSPILGYLLGYSGTNSTACQRLSSQTRYVIDISCPASVSSLEVRAA